MKKNTPKKYSLTIGIPAFNEENNIVNLLQAIKQQEARSFSIKQIIVLCDGSTDSTADLVEAYTKKNKNVYLIRGKKRRGKTQRLNDLLSLHKGDIFISCDADILPTNKHVFEVLLKHFKDSEVCLVAANARPMKARTFAEKLASLNSDLWYEAGKSINNGDNIFNISGQLFALRGSFAKHFRYPKGIFADEKYLYLTVKQQNKKFRFAERAVISFRSPATMKDYFYQSSRFLMEPDQIAPHFSPKLLASTTMPFHRKLKAIVKTFMREPLYTSLVLAVCAVFRLIPHKSETIASESIWTNIASTKELVTL